MNGETPGGMIRRARQEERFTQAQLATELGVHKNTVADWEKGKYFPDRHWAALNKILHINLRPPGAEEPRPEPNIPADVMEVIRKNYAPDKQAEIIEMLEELSGRDVPESGKGRSQPGDAAPRRAG